MGKSDKEEKIQANLEKFNKMAAELDDERSKKKKSKKSKKEHRKREHTPEKEVSFWSTKNLRFCYLWHIKIDYKLHNAPYES